MNTGTDEKRLVIPHGDCYQCTDKNACEKFEEMTKTADCGRSCNDFNDVPHKEEPYYGG